MNILDELSDYAKTRVENAKKQVPLHEIRRLAEDMPKGEFGFEKALKKPDISFICECKKASPSKGIIAENYDYMQIARDYERAGADCISVLTEPKWFLGDDRHLKEITSAVKTPCIRKDFTVDEYMIYGAKLLGASAALLICAVLEGAQIKEYISVCDSLGISALVETHDEREIDTALDAGARIIGVNNRNLKDFSVNTQNSINLRKKIPPEIIFVSESGVKSSEDVERLKKAGTDAVLIGETLMRAPDKVKALTALRGKK